VAEKRSEREVALKERARQDKAEAIKTAALADRRVETLRNWLAVKNASFACLKENLKSAEKALDQRCVTDANGVSQPLHEVQLAQPELGEVNVDIGCQGKRVAATFVATMNAGSLKAREGNIGQSTPCWRWCSLCRRIWRKALALNTVRSRSKGDE
jgi:hypothetical protein